jgi:hypothetical protein
MRIDSIENILDEYEFQRVQKVMKALEWRWYGTEDVFPSIAEIRRQARGLLEDVYRYEDSACITMGRGGFEANRLMEVGSLNKYLSLKFVVEEGNNHE